MVLDYFDLQAPGRLESRAFELLLRVDCRAQITACAVWPGRGLARTSRGGIVITSAPPVITLRLVCPTVW